MLFSPRISAITNNHVRASTRISNLDSNRTLDEKARRSRKSRQLDGLEQDNSHDDPHANLSWHKSAPRFEDEMIGGPSSKKPRKGKDDRMITNEKARRRKLARPEFNKQRFKKSFNDHVTEQSNSILYSADPDYRRVNAYQLSTAPPAGKPARKFCAVCGFTSKYSCTRCGAKYCSLSCRDVHNDTRCMKWLA